MIVAASSGLGACQSAGIRDAYAAKDSLGRMKAKVFPVSCSETHTVVEFVSGRDSAVFRAQLFTPAGAGSFQQADTAAQECNPGLIEKAPGKGETTIDLQLMLDLPDGSKSATGPWTAGEYNVDLYVDDEFDRTVRWLVE